jgi:ABC-2 type transport system ATP-binding protein
VRRLRERGVTIILTTHYIDEAEEMADRIGVINGGGLILVEEKAALMTKLGKRQLTLHLVEPLAAIPDELAAWGLELKSAGHDLVYTATGGTMDISTLLDRVRAAQIAVKDLETHQSSLEDIFLSLVSTRS